MFVLLVQGIPQLGKEKVYMECHKKVGNFVSTMEVRGMVHHVAYDCHEVEWPAYDGPTSTEKWYGTEVGYGIQAPEEETALATEAVIVSGNDTVVSSSNDTIVIASNATDVASSSQEEDQMRLDCQVHWYKPECAPYLDCDLYWFLPKCSE